MIKNINRCWKMQFSNHLNGVPPNHITKDFLLPLITGLTLCLKKDAKNIACPCFNFATLPSDIISKSPPSNSDSGDNKQVIDIFRTGGSCAQLISLSICQS